LVPVSSFTDDLNQSFVRDCIDNVCIESLSINLTDGSLRRAARGAQNLEKKISEMKATDAGKLQNEYKKLVEALQDGNGGIEADSFMANPGKVTRFILARSEIHF